MRPPSTLAVVHLAEAKPVVEDPPLVSLVAAARMGQEPIAEIRKGVSLDGRSALEAVEVHEPVSFFERSRPQVNRESTLRGAACWSRYARLPHRARPPIITVM